MAREEAATRGMRFAGIAVHALLAVGIGSVFLAALQLGDFTPVPSMWSIVIPVLGGVSFGLARMSVHEMVGCVAVVLVASPVLAAVLVGLPASAYEGAAVVRAALRAALVADLVFLLPPTLAGVIVGRWVAGFSGYRARPFR